MRKIISLLLFVGFTTLISCGPSTEEKAAAEKARQDSINTVMMKMTADSTAAAEEALMKAKADSVANAMHTDSIAKAEMASKKKAMPAKSKKAVQSPPDHRSESTKKSDAAVHSEMDKFKKKK